MQGIFHTERQGSPNLQKQEKSNEKRKKFSYGNTASPYELDGRPPLKVAIPLGLQHVLAMFVGNLTPLLIIMGACGLTADAGYGALRTALLQNAMTVAGIVTLVQMFSIGPIGGKVPIVMGTSSGFLGVFKSVTAVLGQGALTYGAILGATIVSMRRRYSCLWCDYGSLYCRRYFRECSRSIFETAS